MLAAPAVRERSYMCNRAFVQNYVDIDVMFHPYYFAGRESENRAFLYFHFFSVNIQFYVSSGKKSSAYQNNEVVRFGCGFHEVLLQSALKELPARITANACPSFVPQFFRSVLCATYLITFSVSHQQTAEVSEDNSCAARI